MAHGLVICLSGRIGSGKSSVADKLGHVLGWQKAGFGDYLRQRIAQDGRDPNSRQALQDLGQSLVNSDPDGFCTSVLSSARFAPGGDLILDGIRHVDIFRCVTRLVAPSNAILIHISADDAQLKHRVATRARGVEDLPRAEAHPVESELSASLPEIADRVIDGNASLKSVVAECLSALESFGLAAEIVSGAKQKVDLIDFRSASSE